MKRIALGALVMAALVAGSRPAHAQAQTPAPTPAPAQAAAPANLDRVREARSERRPAGQGAGRRSGARPRCHAGRRLLANLQEVRGGSGTIGDARYAGIKDYAAHYGTLTDAKATELTDGAIALEEKRLALIKRYVADLRGILPAVKVARFYQVEMALNKKSSTCAFKRGIPLAQ